MYSEDTMVFLPADTPTDNTLNRYNYQLGKKGQLRKHRTLNRLRAYEMEKIAKRRRTPYARDARPRPLVKLEVIKGDEFLNTHRKEFLELFRMTEKYQKGDQIGNTAIYPDSEIQLEERDHSHARALQLKVGIFMVIYLHVRYLTCWIEYHCDRRAREGILQIKKRAL